MTGDESRRLVTILFSDIEGSTELGESLDAEYLRTLMGRYFESAERAIQRHGGTVEKFIGDAVMAVFGLPALHEDDALRAVRAAIELRESVRSLGGELHAHRGLSLRSRIGINTGEVVAGDATRRQQLVTGEAVNLAARLEQSAQPDEILLGPLTHHLVRDAVDAIETAPLVLKGKAEPVRAWRLQAAVPGAEPHARRLDRPMVGRADELATLNRALAEAVDGSHCRLVTIIGPAGIGKSRLVYEFVRGIGDRASVLRGRCLPYGEGITYWPIALAIRSAAGIRDSDGRDAAWARLVKLTASLGDSERVAAAIGTAIGLRSEATAREEIGWAARRLLEGMARQRPLILVIDDFQWAEPTMLDLVESVVVMSRGAPMLVLCVARPELHDVHPGWAAMLPQVSTLRLESLDADDVDALVGNLADGEPMTPAIRERVATIAEGNPLFLEELVAALVDDDAAGTRRGKLVDETVAGADRERSRIRTPPTIQALLAARLDRLEPGERSVAQRASVVGRVFQRTPVLELSPDAERPSVEGRLFSLVRHDLIRPDVLEQGGDDAFRFRHLLVRDAAYDGLPKTERAQLHQRFADWLVRTVGERLTEYREIVGYHLEQAWSYRRELGETEAALADLGSQAAAHLGAAADAAFDRSDLPAAAALYQRAVAALPQEDDRRVLWGSARSDALVQLGHQEEGRREADELARHAERRRDSRLAAWAAVSRLRVDLYSGEFDVANGRAQMDRAIDAFRAAGDTAGLTHAWLSIAHTYWFELRGQKSLEAFEQAFRQAEQAGRMSDQVSIAMWLAAAYGHGGMPATEGLERLDEVASRLTDRRLLGATARARGQLLALLGRFDDSRREIAASRRIFGELAMPYEEAQAGQVWYLLGQLSGQMEEVLPEVEAGCEMLATLGERSLLSTSLSQLAAAYVDLGRHADAERTLARARDMANRDDRATQSLWRAVIASLASARGDHEAALAYADEAFREARSADFPSILGELYVRAGEVRVRAGRAGARAMFDGGRARFLDKGAPAGVAWVDRRERGVVAGMTEDRTAEDPLPGT